jgi:hypothetical protein
MKIVRNHRIGICFSCHEKTLDPLKGFPKGYLLRPGRPALLNFPQGKLFKVKSPKRIKVGLVGTIKGKDKKPCKLYVHIDLEQLDVEDEVQRWLNHKS